MEEVKKTKRTKPRLGGGKRAHRDKRRQARKEQAEARQALYDLLSPEEKLAKAGPRQKKRLLAAAGK